jgi:hypothetical protein
MNGDNVILACTICGWTASARKGDILVSVQAPDGACSEHKVVRT